VHLPDENGESIVLLLPSPAQWPAFLLATGLDLLAGRLPRVTCVISLDERGPGARTLAVRFGHGGVECVEVVRGQPGGVFDRTVDDPDSGLLIIAPQARFAPVTFCMPS
jgi:hypothetical protein